MPPETFWKTIAANIKSPGRLLNLGYEVNYRCRFRLAAWIYLMAADAGEVNGLLFLAYNRLLYGDIKNAETAYRAAAKKGSSHAYISLAEIYEERGDGETTKQLIEEMFHDRNADSEYWSHAWKYLARICDDKTEVQNVRMRLERAAEGWDASARNQLGNLDDIFNDVKDDENDTDSLSELKVLAENLRRAHDLLEAATAQLVESSLADKASFPQLVESFQKRITEESLETSNGDLVTLGKLYTAHGQIDSSKLIFLKATNFLGDDGNLEGKIPALIGLVNSMRLLGDTALADRAWKYGLEPDGSVSAPWHVDDQRPLSSIIGDI